MSEWLEASERRREAYVAWSGTARGTEAHRAAWVAYSAACDDLDALDEVLRT